MLRCVCVLGNDLAREFNVDVVFYLISYAKGRFGCLCGFVCSDMTDDDHFGELKKRRVLFLGKSLPLHTLFLNFKCMRYLCRF